MARVLKLEEIDSPEAVPKASDENTYYARGICGHFMEMARKVEEPGRLLTGMSDKARP